MVKSNLQGKVAVITGAGRGQGRSHAVALAAEGVDTVLVDVPGELHAASYGQSSRDDLDETATLVSELGSRVHVIESDVRDRDTLEAGISDAVQNLGRLDIVIANAGIAPRRHRFWKIPDTEWDEVIAVNLTGVWRTAAVCAPHMITAGNGGSIVLTSSTAGLRGSSGIAAYVASKGALVALTQAMARELAPENIRVNAIAPTNVNTPMLQNPDTYRLIRPDLDNPTAEDASQGFSRVNLLPQPWVESEDVSNAVIYLVSDYGKTLTGHVLPVDLGGMLR